MSRAAAEHAGAFRLPMHVHETLAKVKRAKADLQADGKLATSAVSNQSVKVLSQGPVLEVP